MTQRIRYSPVDLGSKYGEAPKGWDRIKHKTWGKHLTGVTGENRNDGRRLDGDFLSHGKEIELPAGSLILTVTVERTQNLTSVGYVKREKLVSKTGTLVHMRTESRGGPEILIKDGDFHGSFGKFRDVIESALAEAETERTGKKSALSRSVWNRLASI